MPPKRTRPVVAAGGDPQSPGIRAPPATGGRDSRTPPASHSSPESIGKRSPAVIGGHESSGSATGVVASRRMTRSRARELVLKKAGNREQPESESAGAGCRQESRYGSLDLGAFPDKMQKRTAAELVGECDKEDTQQYKMAAAAELVGCREKEQGNQPYKTAAAAAAGLDSSAFPASSRPLLPRYPRRPDSDDAQKWMQECNKIKKLRAPRKNLLTTATMAGSSDKGVVLSTAGSSDNSVVLSAARYVVSISSAHDEEDIFQCTGMVIGWGEEKKCTRILTSSTTVCNDKGKLHDPKPKLVVRLPNNSIFDGHLLFFNNHYGVALLEVMTDLSLLQTPFGSSPTYGQKIFLLGRDETSALMVKSGEILWVDNSACGRNHCLQHNYDMPEFGIGGLVIDLDGNVIGITLDHGSVVTAISTILTCIEMWTQFSRIARPVICMSLRSVELLDVSLREKLSVHYNINKGFIASQVGVNSNAERVGIRLGDVIVPLHEQCGSITLPQFEDFLLSFGWGYLQGLYSTVDLMLEVHDPLSRTVRNVNLPVWFSDVPEREDEV